MKKEGREIFHERKEDDSGVVVVVMLFRGFVKLRWNEVVTAILVSCVCVLFLFSFLSGYFGI